MLSRPTRQDQGETRSKVRSQRKKTILFGNFSQHGGGVFPNPKTFFVNLPSIFLYAKFILRCKNMFYKWGGSDILSISTFNHHSRILKVVAFGYGVPKRGGWGGGPTFGKNSQIMSFFFWQRTIAFCTAGSVLRLTNDLQASESSPSPASTCWVPAKPQLVENLQLENPSAWKTSTAGSPNKANLSI